MDPDLKRAGTPPGRLAAGLLVAVLALLAWSLYKPHDLPTWALEVTPAAVGIVVLLMTFRNFPMTRLAYVLIALHCALLIVGGHYTYAEVPIGNWAKDYFHLSRNHYDRLGHFLQGLVPAVIAREVLIRKQIVVKRGWVPFLVISICMGISACYELVEWLVAVVDSTGSGGGSGATSQAFLGTQGDVWDTQEDMAFCLAGSVFALLAFTRLHDSEIRRVEGR